MNKSNPPYRCDGNVVINLYEAKVCTHAISFIICFSLMNHKCVTFALYLSHYFCTQPYKTKGKETRFLVGSIIVISYKLENTIDQYFFIQAACYNNT